MPRVSAPISSSRIATNAAPKRVRRSHHVKDTSSTTSANST